MKKFLLILLFTFISFGGLAQEYLMQNGSVNTCSGTFFDSGGEFGNYADNENLVFTICPENDGERIRLDFQEFNLSQNNDVMRIYDGNSTSDLWVAYSGTNSPIFIIASLINTTGCITIEFISDSTDNESGWAADISCILPCQDITAQLDSTIPAQNSEGVIEVCTGDNIALNGSGIFEVDGTGASYTWDLGDGNTASGQSVNVSYDTPGVYLVNLDIRDTNTDNIIQGCPNTNAINLVIRVSGAPDYTGTSAESDILCFGESTTIEAVVNPLTLIYNCPPPESETTFLPDGNGAAYYTCINVTCFDPSAVLTDVSQIFDICMNLEHSYLGDLQITVISPNGQTAILKNFPGGGGNYLGEANDDDGLTPGVGLDYCFSMAASDILVDGLTITAGSPPRESIAPGSYLPEESFANLIGSPLNGEWCIEIVDNIAIDNGYIFSWELNFDENVPQEDFTFIPTFTSQSWDADPSITETNGNTITVAPDGSGQYCYTYRTTDVFGCEYTEEVCITVADEDQALVTYYEDIDGDGFGDDESSITLCSDVPPDGYVSDNRDCNDGDPTINPDAADPEGDGIDTNCDGVDGDVLGIDEFNLNSVNIQPNPFEDAFEVNVSSRLNGSSFQIIIFDINGRIVHEQIKIVTNGALEVNGLSNMEKAPYFMSLSNSEFGLNVTKRLIKK